MSHPTALVILSMSPEDASRLVADMAEYPGRPILTPVQENTVTATLVEARGVERTDEAAVEARVRAQTAVRTEPRVRFDFATHRDRSPRFFNLPVGLPRRGDSVEIEGVAYTVLEVIWTVPAGNEDVVVVLE